MTRLYYVLLVVALASGSRIHAQENDAPRHFTNSIGMKFIWIPAGTFLMGSPREEILRNADETRHKVTLSKGFYMGSHLVTQEHWTELMGYNPSFFKGDKNLPVERVAWHDCQEFIKRLADKEKTPYRLPTEAEWECACRAGTTTPFSFGGTISPDQANYDSSATYGTHKHRECLCKTTTVGSFPANAWGLCDMHGNLFEWCQDWYGQYSQYDVTDPRGPEQGQFRVLRRFVVPPSTGLPLGLSQQGRPCLPWHDTRIPCLYLTIEPMSNPPTIVKVGGSLYDLPDLGTRLSAWLATQTGEVILVPGGGPLVETIRRLDSIHHLGSEACHWLAVRTLTINAHFLAHLLPGASIICDLSQRPANAVHVMDMFPFILADEASPDRLPHSWDVTSDSLAARTAILAGARRLVLLKSVDEARNTLASAAGSEDVVDRYFNEVLRRAPADLRVEIVNLRTWPGNRRTPPLPIDG